MKQRLLLNVDFDFTGITRYIPAPPTVRHEEIAIRGARVATRMPSSAPTLAPRC
jgi:hypothetical protein